METDRNACPSGSLCEHPGTIATAGLLLRPAIRKQQEICRHPICLLKTEPAASYRTASTVSVWSAHMHRHTFSSKVLGLSSSRQCGWRSALLRALSLPPSTQASIVGITAFIAK